MKLFSLVLCVGILCTTTTSRGQHHSHQLHKRQTENLDTCSIAVVNNTCNSGYYQEYATILLECNDTSFAVTIRDACITNEFGSLCAGVDSSEINLNIITVCGIDPTTCSPDCQDLLTSTRAQIGCCVIGLNSSFVFRYSYSPWSLCGVETVTEECAPSPVVLPTNPAIDYDCTQDILVERLYDNVLCRTQYLDSLRDATAEFCGNVSFDIYSSCDVDNLSGRYCDISNNSQSQTSDLRQAASDNCADTSICAPLCVKALNNITSCCFISEYNDTTSGESYDWLSYEFWSRCGLSSPGFCERRFNNEVVTIPTGGSTESTGGSTESTGDPTTITDSTKGTSDVDRLKAQGIAVTVTVALFMLLL